MAAIKHVFPGGNTTRGFYSFYNNILFQEEATRIIIIKGGPGVGKSSFMKKLGEKMLELGYDLEHHHCSSDPNSLDGLVIPSIKVALLDGTAPHVVDPIHPGAVDEILHLGDFWNEAGIRAHKTDIMRIQQEVGRLFHKAYDYLAAASHIYDAWSASESRALNTGKVNQKIDTLVSDVFSPIPVSKQPGKQRHLFGTAITPLGLMEYLHTIIGTSKKVYMVKDSPGASAMDLMNKLYTTAVEKGLDVECYHSPIRVEKIEDIIIPALDTAFTVANDYHKAKVIPTNIVDLTACLELDMLQSVQAEIDTDKKVFDDLLAKSIATIQKAKKVHDDMETFYIPNMYFDQIDQVFEKTLQRILQYAEEFYK